MPPTIPANVCKLSRICGEISSLPLDVSPLNLMDIHENLEKKREGSVAEQR